MAKKRITSKPGLFGMTYHYEDGKYVGKSRPGLLGNRKIHYNAEGRQVGTSRPGALSDEVHYDVENKRYISSYQGPVSKIHISNGRPVGKTTPGFFGTNYTSIESDEPPEEFSDEETLDYEDECEEDDYPADHGGKVHSSWKQIIKKIVGVLFALEAIAFVVATIVFALKGKSVAPGIATCIISAVAAFFCFRSAMSNSDETATNEYE